MKKTAGFAQGCLSLNSCRLSQSLAINDCRGYFNRSGKCENPAKVFEEEAMICFDDVSKFILSGITLHIPQGRTAGLIGASGAGKTTFLKLSCGLLAPDAGKVYLGGKAPSEAGKTNRRILSALFADKPFFNRSDTVKENFEILAAVYHLTDAAFRRDYGELSERLGFAEFDQEVVGNLSLGQRRRGELGAALLHRPGILFLDEPLAGIDENAKLAFRTLLEERKRTDHMTVVISSHDMAEISELCDRIILLHGGKLAFYGEKETLRRKILPLEELVLKVAGPMPDLEDMPLEKYRFDGEELKLTYRADYITAPEILQFILQRCSVTQVAMDRPGLEKIAARTAGALETDMKTKTARTKQ